MKKRLFKSLLGAIAVTLSVCGLASCGNSTEKPDHKEEDTLVSISLSGGKKEFTIGDEFTVGDLVVKANYSVSGEKTITDYSVDSSKVKKNEAGTYEITISYSDKTAKYSVVYVKAEDTLVSISLSGGKKEFTIGDEFTVGDLVVKANYSVSGEKTITDYSVDSSKVKKNEVGAYEITISYNDKTAKYSVEYKAEEGVVYYEGFKLKEIENGYSIEETANYNYPTKLTLPSEYDEKPIIEIAELGMTTLNVTELIIPSSITKIGNDAFLGNPNLCIVDMSACSLEIGSGAFYMSNVYAVELGKTTSIGEDAFADSNLCTVHIPSTVKTIGDNAFNTSAFNEVTFGGETFPTLGTNVFGARATNDDPIYLYAKESAWGVLFENVTEEGQPEKVKEFFNVTYGGYFATTEEELNKAGIYRGDATIYLNETSIGSRVLIIVDGYLTVFELYDSKGISIVDDRDERYVLALDFEEKQVERLNPNAKGEYIKDNVLYEYVGNVLTYNMDDSITEVLGGAGIGNSLLRYLNFGENVTKIGAFAFSNSYIFSITFEENVEYIGEMAFFGQEYLQEIIFKGTTPPEIGTAAFCYMSELGICPTMYYNKLYFVGPKIYTPLSVSAWFSDPEVEPFVQAFNQSLEDIGDALVKDGNGDLIQYKSGYSGNFGQLKTSGLYAMGKSYTSDFGTIYMSGVEKGYAVVELIQGDYDGLGPCFDFGYISISDLAGYKEENSPKKLQVFIGFDGKGVRSFITYGSFDLENETFILRGKEAGNYGFHNGQKIELDGYGRIVYYLANGATYIGSYTNENNVLTITDIPNLTSLTYLPDNSSINVNEVIFPSLGAESGIYYDYANHAKLELDGTPYTVEEVNYSGRLYLTFKNQTIEAGYILEDNYIKFKLNDTDKSWEFSKDSKVIVKGYYGNYEDYLNFTIAQISNNMDTYTNNDDTLTLDGYFTATYNDTNYFYTELPNSSTIILFINDEAKILYLNNENQTFEEANTINTEAGLYYLGSSSNYKLYLDGRGNLLYFDGENKFGSYTYDSSTGEFIITKWNNEDNSPVEKGSIQNGTGSLVYSSYGSDSFVAISKTPFVQMPTSWGSMQNYLNVYMYNYSLNDENEYTYTSSYLYIYVTNNTVLINAYGKPFVIVPLESAIVDGTIVNTIFLDNDLTLKFSVTNDSITGVTATSPNYQYEEITTSSSKYQLVWLNDEKTALSFYKIESYPTIKIYNVSWNENQTEATFSDASNTYVISNYGTNDVELTITPISGE